jgi:hypothetical protein
VRLVELLLFQLSEILRFIGAAEEQQEQTGARDLRMNILMNRRCDVAPGSATRRSTWAEQSRPNQSSRSNLFHVCSIAQIRNYR